MSVPPVLELEGLEIGREGDGAPIVADLTLSLAPGESLGLIGASGAGKSLSALALLGLLPPGLRARWRRMALAGQRYAAASAALRPLRGRGIGLVFQEPLAALNPVLPVGFQLAEVLRRHLGLARRAARAEAAAWLERVGLAPPAAFLGRHPHELSGGQRQRVAIALALAPGPPLLIADEPTSALDPPSADEILRLLVGLARERGTALLIVSHELELLARHCERLAVLAEGRIVESAAAAELLAAPREPATRRLVAARLGPPPRPAGAATAVAPEPLLRVRALRVERRARWLRRGSPPILDGLELELRQGEALGLVGPSGSGKTTLARALLGLVPVAGGSIRFAGSELAGLSPRGWRPLRRALQIVFQDPGASLDPRMQVGAIVGEGLRIHRIGRDAREREARVRAALAAAGLDPDCAACYPHELSGGQRQRVAIARALALEPRLLVLDEALSALDAALRRDLLALLDRLRRELGLALLFISHDLAATAWLCERIAVLEGGRIVESGPRDRLLAAPAHPVTRRLLAAAGLA